MAAFLTLAIIGGLLLAFLAALGDALARPGYVYDQAHRSKAMTIVGLLLTSGVGAIYYWAHLRPRIVRSGAGAAPRGRSARRPDPWSDEPDLPW